MFDEMNNSIKKNYLIGRPKDRKARDFEQDQNFNCYYKSNSCNVTPLDSA